MFAVAMVSVPPSGIASRALIARFRITCSICTGSISAGQRFSSSFVSTRIARPSVARSRSPMPRTTWFRSTSTGVSACLRENASNWRTRSAPRPAVCRIIASRRACAGWSPNRLCSISALPVIDASRLLKSCATPAVSRPTAAMVCAWRSRSSVCRRAVTSVYSVTKPPPGSGVAADLELPAARPRPLDRAHAGAGAQHRHPSRDLGLDIDRTEFAAGHLAAQDVLHRQADAQDLRRHAGELGKVLVPCHQPKIAIDHHDAVAHAGQRRLENRPLAGQRFVAAPGTFPARATAAAPASRSAA